MDHKKIREFIDSDDYQELLPFVSRIELDNGDVYKGVIINSDKSTITLIDLSKFKSNIELYEFIELCLDWWWYSSRHIPVNLFYINETAYYMKHYTTHLPNKTNTDITGHQVSLQTIVDNHKCYRRNKTLQSRK